jgi:hypothetical protein
MHLPPPRRYVSAACSYTSIASPYAGNSSISSVVFPRIISFIPPTWTTYRSECPPYEHNALATAWP